MRGSSGYAIAEVLVAVVIISISFIELSGAISKIMRAANQTVLIGKSISVAHSTVEEVMAQSFDAKGSEAGGYVLDFDGTDDYVEIADNPSLNFGSSTDFTISFWANPSTWVQEGKYIIDKTDGEVGYSISIATNLRLQFSISAVDVNTASNALDGLENEWHQFEITCDRNGNAQWYIDGSTSGSAVSISGAGDIDNSSTLTIGSENTPSLYFAGEMDEVRIWNDVRTPAEIKTGYNRSLSDPYEETNLKLYLRMNNGSGSMAFDHSSSMAHGTINNPDDSDIWTSQSSSWSITLGNAGEASWSEYNDVDDFHTVSFTDTDYSQLGGRIYVKYVVVDPTSWAISDAGEGTTTDYKQITVKIGIPGSTDSTQLSAIKSAKIIQNYGLTYSPYGN